jgi:hypothetical protein
MREEIRRSSAGCGRDRRPDDERKQDGVEEMKGETRNETGPGRRDGR